MSVDQAGISRIWTKSPRWSVIVWSTIHGSPLDHIEQCWSPLGKQRGSRSSSRRLQAVGVGLYKAARISCRRPVCWYQRTSVTTGHKLPRPSCPWGRNSARTWVLRIGSTGCGHTICMRRFHVEYSGYIDLTVRKSCVRDSSLNSANVVSIVSRANP